MTPVTVFIRCVEAIRQGLLIERVSSTDKEYHFQNWFRARLEETGLNFEAGGRNSYPDFRMVATTEGYELKGLAYPGRDANFDSNSQVPSGFHNGRTIYYVFGRYPKKPDGNTYPVIDLVLCHGDFLNADHEYTHKNKNVKGFGSYGDIMIRDRKMYVVPTPFHLAEGVAHRQTLILPARRGRRRRVHRGGRAPPSRGRRADRRLFVRPPDQRAPPQEDAESRRGPRARIPGLAAERLRRRPGLPAEHPAGIAESSNADDANHGRMTCG